MNSAIIKTESYANSAEERALVNKSKFITGKQKVLIVLLFGDSLNRKLCWLKSSFNHLLPLTFFHETHRQSVRNTTRNPTSAKKESFIFSAKRSM